MSRSRRREKEVAPRNVDRGSRWLWPGAGASKTGGTEPITFAGICAIRIPADKNACMCASTGMKFGVECGTRGMSGRWSVELADAECRVDGMSRCRSVCVTRWCLSLVDYLATAESNCVQEYSFLQSTSHHSINNANTHNNVTGKLR